MAQTLHSRIFVAPNGEKRELYFRPDTNDENVIIATFEQDEYGFQNRTYDDGDVVVDMGSHIGSASLLLHAIKPTLRIIAVEALPENVSIFKRNMQTNHANVTLYENAIAGTTKDPTIKMYYGSKDTKIGQIHRFMGRHQITTTSVCDCNSDSVAVPTITLDEIMQCEHIERIRLVKMDIEGMEREILMATSRDVLRKIIEISGEWHHGDFLPFFLSNAALTETYTSHVSKYTGGHLPNFTLVQTELKLA